MRTPLVRYMVVTFAALCLNGIPKATAAVPHKLNAFTEGERVLYGQIVQSYRDRHRAEAIKQRDVLARNFPKSIHLDNAYYLTGLLEFQENRFAEAVKDFAVVADNFPRSNKRPAALFAKGVAYEKLGLKDQATRLWNQVIEQYPGSFEAQRAWAELKLSKMDGGQLKKSGH